jgi:hypothetical protein
MIFSTGVVDNGSKFSAGVVDTGNKFAPCVVDTGGNLPSMTLTLVANSPPMSLLLVENLPPALLIPVVRISNMRISLRIFKKFEKTLTGWSDEIRTNFKSHLLKDGFKYHLQILYTGYRVHQLFTEPVPAQWLQV